ncbi:MAG: hypothetical protein ACRC17_07095 [Culicoidibacterales bacterium]
MGSNQEKKAFEYFLGDLAKLILVIYSSMAILMTILIFGIAFLTPAGFRWIEAIFFLFILGVDLLLIKIIFAKKGRE